IGIPGPRQQLGQECAPFPRRGPGKEIGNGAVVDDRTAERRAFAGVAGQGGILARTHMAAGFRAVGIAAIGGLDDHAVVAPLYASVSWASVGVFAGDDARAELTAFAAMGRRVAGGRNGVVDLPVSLGRKPSRRQQE